MSTKTFSVIPIEGGWAVEAARGEQLMFLSGGRAEAKAKQLAQLAGKLGDTAQVLIHDRDGRLIGKRLYPAEDAREAQARRPVLNLSR